MDLWSSLYVCGLLSGPKLRNKLNSMFVLLFFCFCFLFFWSLTMYGAFIILLLTTQITALLDSVEFVIVPFVNPDGYDVSAQNC